MAETAAGTERTPQASGKAPRVIAGRYEVLGVLGEGSSARTLLCSDLRENRRVAVKELHFAHLGNWKYLELFEREASMLKKLEHPGIPRVFDFFPAESEAHSLYIVQEFIEGASLQQRMDAGPMLGQQEIFELALGMLDVLDYLHGRAPPVLHRDIKPSNVLLRTSGSPALIDFGGVCFGWRPPGSAGTTVVGTFGYMPPEQLVGQSGPTSDLYALGATLLHVVSGRPPSEFPFDSGRIEVPADLPVNPSLGRLIDALLRPAPRDRPPSAEAARSILLNQAASPTAAVVQGAPASRAIARRVVSMATGGDGPRFVDLGDPPRKPRGEFRDVYRNLMHPLFPARPLWSPGMHALWLGITGVASVATFGVAPALYFVGVQQRHRKYDWLFRHGQFTRGSIRTVHKPSGGIYGTFKYEFDVGDTTYVAFMDCAVEMAKYWSEGDTVPVLYDPNDPGRSCFVYR